MKIMHIPRLLPQRITLRARLTLIYGGLFFAAGIVLLGSTYALFNQQLTSGGLTVVSGNSGVSKTGDPSPSPSVGGHATVNSSQIITNNGDVLTGKKAEKWMLGEQTRIRDAATTSLITQGGIALLIVGGAAAGFGWLIAGRTLAPLRRVTETARRISAAPVTERGLHERINLPGPDDEVKELADTFDTMVEQLDRAFAGQRRFVANASHELRTPLTLGRAMVEIAMHRKDASADLQTLGGDLLEINSRHEQLITGLLLLASAENEVIHHDPVDLADIIDHVVGDTAHEAAAAHVIVHAEAGEAVTTGDALLLERLVQNLVQNGIRHNVNGGWTRITSGRGHDGRIQLEVSNTGSDVPPYEIPVLFEPFRRLDGERLATAKGPGLGLSIVRAIATAHNGEVTAVPREGGGLVVTASLPAAPDDGCEPT